MSFGVSPGDVITLLTITRRVYKGWKGAVGDYTEVTIQLRTLTGHLELAKKQLISKKTNAQLSKQDLAKWKECVADCRGVIEELEVIIKKFASLEPGKKSKKKNWDRLRLGNKNLDGLRQRLMQRSSELFGFLLIMAVAALGRMEPQVNEINERVRDIPEIRRVVEKLASGRAKQKGETKKKQIKDSSQQEGSKTGKDNGVTKEQLGDSEQQKSSNAEKSLQLHVTETTPERSRSKSPKLNGAKSEIGDSGKAYASAQASNSEASMPAERSQSSDPVKKANRSEKKKDLDKGKAVENRDSKNEDPKKVGINQAGKKQAKKPVKTPVKKPVKMPGKKGNPKSTDKKSSSKGKEASKVAQKTKATNDSKNKPLGKGAIGK